MTQPHLHSAEHTAEDTATVSPQHRWRPALAALATTVVTAATFPLHLLLVLMFSISASRYDTSGQGGPFKNCESASACSDPNYLWMLGAAGFMILLWLVAAQVGQLLWGAQPRLRRLFTLLAVSAGLTVAGWAIVYYLMMHATHAIF
jgi:hypothetical protein